MTLEEQFKNAIVSPGFHIEILNEWLKLRNKFIKISSNHYIKHSATDVVYHYYTDLNKFWRKKHNRRNRKTQSYLGRFYKRQLEYKGWFYDLPDGFNILKDWESVYNAYLNYLQSNSTQNETLQIQ